MLGSGPNRLRPRQTTRPIHPLIKLINSRTQSLRTSPFPPLLPDHILPDPFPPFFFFSFSYLTFLKEPIWARTMGPHWVMNAGFMSSFSSELSLDRACHRVWSLAAGPPLAVPNGACLPLPLSLQLCLDGLQKAFVNRNPSSWTPTSCHHSPCFGSNKLRFRASHDHSRAFSHSIGTEPASHFMWMDLSYFKCISMPFECC